MMFRKGLQGFLGKLCVGIVWNAENGWLKITYDTGKQQTGWVSGKYGKEKE